MTVTLDNCDREPIHTPGAIQPQGALIAIDAQRVLRHVSANAAALLGADALPGLGRRLGGDHLHGCPVTHALLEDAMASLQSGTAALPLAQTVSHDGRDFDLVAHCAPGGLLVLEFELRPAGAEALEQFALAAHRALDALRRQRTIDALLSVAVQEVRRLTGFDRVMAYRFRHDDSGEVVAEAAAPQLDVFLGRRYPASDIPAQARRLYTEHTLRCIADTAADPVPVQADQAGEQLDMSACVLRAVSPVHIEYLRNMGVGASMSVSIVVNGALWGMLACHHYGPRHVPHSVRMACDVIGQLLAANVQAIVVRQGARRLREAGVLRDRLTDALLRNDDSVQTLTPFAETLGDLLDAGAAVFAEGARLHAWNLPLDAARMLAQWLASDAANQRLVRHGEDLLLTHRRDALPEELRDLLGPWCGVLALRYDPAGRGLVALLRQEQVETVNWGGKPEKAYATGPLGPRLTPRGSFALWQETVRDLAAPWTAPDLELAQTIAEGLRRAHGVRLAESNGLRTQLIAMLGHDLRDPLHSIRMAARVLETPAGQTAERGSVIGARIQSSSGRMQRLVSQVLDLSRIQGGIGLGLHRQPVDVAALVSDLVDEARTAHPHVQFLLDSPEALQAAVDADRLAQVVTNLVGNARHHGAPGEPVYIHLVGNPDDGVRLAVRNTAPPIAEELLPVLFNPFKRQAGSNSRNRTGLGLGLYIAHEIVQGHGGTLAYSHEGGQVVFTAVLPPG